MRTWKFLRSGLPCLAVGLAVFGLATQIAGPHPAAAAETRLQATYAATIAGFPIGSGNLDFGLSGNGEYRAAIDAQIRGLASLIAKAADPGSAFLLRHYALQHRMTTMPLYQATLHLVRLFTDERLHARPFRSGLLRLGALPPIRRIMGRLLSERNAA